MYCSNFVVQDTQFKYMYCEQRQYIPYCKICFDSSIAHHYVHVQCLFQRTSPNLLLYSLTNSCMDAKNYLIEALEVGSQTSCWSSATTGYIQFETWFEFEIRLLKVIACVEFRICIVPQTIVELYQIGLNCQERQWDEAPECSKVFETN